MAVTATSATVMGGRTCRSGTSSATSGTHRTNGSKKWRAEVARSFEVLDAAMPESVLPEDPPGEAVDALEAWMLDLRRQRFDTPAR